MTLGATGEIIAGRYRIESFLGRGGYGEVWRALDTHRNHLVALKLLRNVDRRKVWGEASVLTALKSQHILEVNNADVAIDVPYLDTALAKCSVDKVSQPLGVEPRQAVDWIRRALRGLGLCHRRGLLHRDVKPGNIFLTGENDARLGDFGVAAFMDASGSADPAGDPRIRAPEFYGGGRATVASDIYATAVTLYALLAGRMPFAQDYQADLDKAIKAGDYPELRDVAPHVSRALAERVREGMAVDPARRYGDAGAFDAKLGLLPARIRHFTPTSIHSDHCRCWIASGQGADLSVCVLEGSKEKYKKVETRRIKADSRILEHCDEVKNRDLPKRLRKVFDALR